MKYLRIGDIVLVHVPEADRPYHNAVTKYNDKEMVVSDRKVVGHSSKVYYKLSGAKSDYDIPYSFVSEWLIPLQE